MTPSTPQSTFTFDDLGFYQQTIVTDTGCALEDAFKVERIMREFVLHSTLDWLSRAQFRREARKAYKILQDERPEFEHYFAENHRLCQEFLKKQKEATTASEETAPLPQEQNTA